jgi:hypothetical protein
MTDWQTTAKTIYCDAVDDEVTILIFKDFSVHCTGCNKYSKPNDITTGIVKEKSRKLKKLIKCQGEQCARVIEYKNKIQAEEAN